MYALVETMLLQDSGEVRHRNRHLLRLARSCQANGFFLIQIQLKKNWMRF